VKYTKNTGTTSGGYCKKSNRKNGIPKTMPHRKERSNLDEAIYKQAYKKLAQARPCRSPKHRRLFKFMNKLLVQHLGSTDIGRRRTGVEGYL
jgi:hypothetical protein